MSSSSFSIKSVSILGSTGSIGCQSLEVIRAFPERFRLVGLSAGSNIILLQEQVLIFRPQIICVLTQGDAERMRDFCSAHSLLTQVVWGDSGLLELSVFGDPDLLVVAIVGTAALMPTVHAIRQGISIGLACKEILVAAGDYVMALAREKGVSILPIDSEHAAIKQCLAGILEDEKQVSKLVLTASGGPFWNRSLETFSDITRGEALQHPNWTMGSKITIDSATMMNKGLEVIEAHHLFGIDYDRLDVIIHPTSIVHSLVEFSDGTFLAQMGLPDMRFPIQYVLTYPEKLPNPWPKMQLSELKVLAFHAPDFEKFPLLQMAFDAGRQGGAAPLVMNAANEVAVRLFLDEKIKFLDIANLVRDTVARLGQEQCPSFEDIVALDHRVREEVGCRFA